MKLLCFSDLHRDCEAAGRLVELASDPGNDIDILIGAGDFANQRKGAEDTLNVLAAVNLPAILVPGNGESVEELSDAASIWKSAIVLHGSSCEVKGVTFYGIGGGIPVTPFGPWSYDFDEKQAAELLASFPKSSPKRAPTVLVTHSPPIDSVDRDSSNRIRGSQAIRHCVETEQPQLVVCGHIHSDWEKQATIGDTRILNAGPRGVIMKIECETESK